MNRVSDNINSIIFSGMIMGNDLVAKNTKYPTFHNYDEGSIIDYLIVYARIHYNTLILHSTVTYFSHWHLIFPEPNQALSAD